MYGTIYFSYNNYLYYFKDPNNFHSNSQDYYNKSNNESYKQNKYILLL